MAKKEMPPETLAFIEAHAGDNVQTLALQAARFPKVNMAVAITQIAARQTAQTKLPTWWKTIGIRYPHHLSMEQCSSEVTARYKATLIPEELKAGSFTDLSGGFGVDFVCMAQVFSEATYVERQEELCLLATHNFPLLGLPDAQVINTDSVRHLEKMPPQSVIFIDPARRNQRGGKVIAISDCEPNINLLYEQLIQKAQRVIVKLSPMLDISQALEVLPCVREVHIIAVKGECKELLLILEAEAKSAEARIICTNLPTIVPEVWPTPFSFTRQEEEQAHYTLASEIATYLYEPNSVMLKAGAFRIIAAHYDIEKLHPNSHLYTSHKLIEGFPGRCFKIVFHGGFGKREIKELLASVKKANLTVRNFPTSVADLRKRLKLDDGGDNYLFATTLANGEKQWILCKKI
jgi:16S rRNA G966 N2-methylase RsmD